ncbi:MAG: cobyrinate a,c-diamide synthase [Deltaproteobacteria bacterium]|nr:cobyrinate a,c-diamide synthase [Candidatus Anaeroferrophillacea bacterium]
MSTAFHRLCLAGTHSGAGKTTLTIGIVAALRRRGLTVQPFKTGPDYIDAGFHRRAAAREPHNLDLWMMGEAAVRRCYEHAAAAADAAVVEGVMGLFDGSGADGSGSTAHLARVLDLPVVLVVNAKAMAGSIAALVYGYARFWPDLEVIGVIANRVSGRHHRELLAAALENAGLPPLLGCLPPDPAWTLPERHLGLISDTESTVDEEWLSPLAAAVEKHIDLDRLLAAARGRRPVPSAADADNTAGPTVHRPAAPLRLGLARDDAFHFYYRDNLDRLAEAGVETVSFSPLADQRLPENLDGIYFGGGFPEMFAARLAANTALIKALHRFAASGRMIYAECGGLMYLCRALIDRDGRRHPMAAILPAETVMENRLHRLGYREATLLADGLFGPVGTVVRGHEFHWSSIAGDTGSTAFYDLRRADGSPAGCAGMRIKNVWASYLHVHFASAPGAARAFARALTTEQS